ncbi:MAG TPA: putative LPS assembly protein LptD [Vicinamibacterales bacterium]|nr:putative LPS assembly protein LptD [Vicinamibacterales bacterium]
MAGILLTPSEVRAQSDIAGCKLAESKQASLLQINPNHLRLAGTVEHPVQVDCDDVQLFADAVELYRSEGRLVAEGHVTFVSGTNRIAAERMEFNTKTKTGTFYAASGTAIMREGTPGESGGGQEPYAYFWGEELHKIGPKRYRIVRGGFTACVQPTPRWEVSSGSLTLDVDDHVLLKNAVFRVKGVPVLYMPLFYYPMQEDDRSTGFVMPTYGTGTIVGQKISNAFFWAIGRSHDATFVHDWFTKTGQGLGTEYRYQLGSGSQGNARFYRLNEKPITTLLNGVETKLEGQQSYKFNGTLVQALPGGLQARADADYFSSLRTQQRLEQNVYQATNRRRGFGGNITGNRAEYVASATFEQRDIFDTADRYVRNGTLPRVTLSKGERAIGKVPIYLGATGEYVTFVRSTIDKDVTINDRGLTRLDVNPTVRVPFTKWPFLTVNSVVSWRGTRWSESLDANRMQVEEKFGRSYFEFQSRITGPVFNRIWNTPGNGYAEKFKHVVVPTLSVQRTSTIDGFGRVVVLDGIDSIVGGVTRYTYSLANRLYAKKESSREIATIDFSQTYYTLATAAQFDRNYQSSFTTVDPSKAAESNFSPIAVTARVAPSLNVQTDFRAEWNSKVSAVTSLGANGTVNTPLVQATGGWSQRRFVKELPGFSEAQASHYLNATATVHTRTNNVGGTYSFNYDMRRDQFLQQRFITYYNAQCCGVAVEWQSFNLSGSTAGIPQDRRFNISVTLAGIGAVPSFFGALSGQQDRR